MSDFTLLDEDYIDLIVDEKSLAMFNRMKEIISLIKGVPAKDCFHLVVEFTHLDSDIHNVPRRQFIMLGDPALQ